MEVELRVENVGGAGEAELRALFGAHGWVTSVTLAPEIVASASGEVVTAPCARVRFRTRTADDAAAAAMHALTGAAIGGGSASAIVDYAPPTPHAVSQPIAALAVAAGAGAAPGASGAQPSAPAVLPPAGGLPGSTPGSGHASSQPSPHGGAPAGGAPFASPLRRSGGATSSGAPPMLATAAATAVAAPQPTLQPAQPTPAFQPAYGDYAQPSAQSPCGSRGSRDWRMAPTRAAS
ncbi:hypothetical protein KFE25_004771 [Diacronema lutheri]|uniref:RRM domain-containing protein n=1 Tax=Diacronema lutheri TaxID=2081491 RepID=A0A8J5XGY3_DIALT|nr:hypothetical protein KFE25_004771 [Diacronema lutheri]